MYSRLRETYIVAKGLNIIYINLDKRKDRDESIINELEDFGNNLVRLSATYDKKGYLGCTMSHIRALEYAIENNLENILIFEDDFMFTRDKQLVYDEIISFINSSIDWDVLLISGNRAVRKPYNKYVDKVTNSQTASAYLVNKHYYTTLLNHLKTGYEKLKKTGNRDRYMNDMYWKKLQEVHNWFALKPFAGIQRASYSDIENRTVDYGV
jgi:GR25 family glycosyltransferase involved in LPS biosynthesis